MGIEEVLSAPRCSWQRAYIERVIGSIRRDCLDHMVVFNEASMYRHVKAYVSYYQHTRTHLSLAKDAPETRAVQPPELGRVVAIAEVSGLHHPYERPPARFLYQAGPRVTFEKLAKLASDGFFDRHKLRNRQGGWERRSTTSSAAQTAGCADQTPG
jgi:hypothetical protein